MGDTGSLVKPNTVYHNTTHSAGVTFFLSITETTMTFTKDEATAYIHATEFLHQETSGCQGTAGAHEIRFQVKIGETNFFASIFKPETGIAYVMICRAIEGTGYDSAKFELDTHAGTEQEKADHVVSTVVAACKSYVEEQADLLKTAHGAIKEELSNTLKFLVEQEVELADSTLDKIESYVRKALDKFDLTNKVEFNNFFLDETGIVSAAIGDDIIVKVGFPFHKTRTRNARVWRTDLYGFQERKAQFIKIDQVDIATRPVPSCSKPGQVVPAI